MLRACLRGANSTVRKKYGGTGLTKLQQCRHYTSGQSGGAAKVVATGVIAVGGGIGGTVLYAKWDPKFRAAVEKNVPYSDWALGLALGPAPQDTRPSIKKQMELAQLPSMMDKQMKASKAKTEKNVKEAAESPAKEMSPPQPAQSIEEASAQATHIISAISEVQSIPAPCDTEAAVVQEECKECSDHKDTPAVVHPDIESAPQPLKERPVEEVTARLAQQDQEEQDVLASVSMLPLVTDRETYKGVSIVEVDVRPSH